MSSFLEQYVEEARENVEELVGGLLRLESETGDAVNHTVKELFRFAHNLKGMSGAMGLDGITETAHKMEDLLDKYRQGGGQPTNDEVDVLLAASDALEQMIEQAATGENPPASDQLISLLLNHIGGSSEPATTPESAPSEPSVAAVGAAPTEDGWYAVSLTETAQLAGARSAILLRAAGELADLADTRPDRAQIESGKHKQFQIRLLGDGVDRALTELRGLTDIASVEPVSANVAPAPGAGATTRLEIRLSQATQLPGARSAIALRAIGDITDIVSTNPDRQTIEAGRASDFIVEVASGAADEVIAAVSSITDIDSVSPVAAPAAKAKSDGGGGGGGDRANAANRATVRVEVERLDDLMDLVSELVVGRGLLDEHVSRLGDRGLGEALATVHRTISDLQAMVAKVRMISLEKTFARLTRIVRDTARDVGKPVRFVTSGEDTELDRSMVDEVADPLMHLLRNSVDHGIEESTETRVAAGKDAEGEVALRAYSEGNQVVIEVSDDGGGINVDKVVAKAIKNGLITEEEAAVMPDEAKVDLVFAAGLSTRDQASKISGRGVGMDVVRTAASKLGGTVTVETTPGKGSLFVIRLPLSLAVAEALLVRICDETWAIPIDQVEETLQVKEEDLRSVRGQPVIDLRGQVVSVIHGRRRMYDEEQPDGALSAVVFRHKGRRVALTVDDLIGRSEVVVKPLPSDLTDIDLASSVTILGDGSVGLILDVGAVMDTTKLRVVQQ